MISNPRAPTSTFDERERPGLFPAAGRGKKPGRGVPFAPPFLFWGGAPGLAARAG